MLDALLDYLSAVGSDKANAFQPLKLQLKELLASDLDTCTDVVRRATDVDLTYTNAVALSRIRKSIKLQANGETTTRIAVVGSFTTHQLCDLTDLFLFSHGINAEIYEADYGLFRQEILDPTSGLYSFNPHFIYVATNWRDLLNRPTPTDPKEVVQNLLHEECKDWSLLWQTAFSGTGAQIIQNAFDAPFWQQLGNHEMRQAASLKHYITRVNLQLYDSAPEYVTLLDIDAMATTHGKKSWSDERFYLQAKLPCAPDYLVDYAHNLASIISAQKGATRKCLVLDLDNTLWGGVIGDDGVGGIKLGQGDPESESFLYFQKYIKALKQRGVILAVCSKNDDANAREVFLSHAEMELRLEDISCFVANWNDKASNIRTIAKTLDIGLNSIVFVDDNPAERAIVRQLLPEVAVPELPIDPSGYIEAVDKHRFFQVVTLSTEDFKRTEFYKSNEARTTAQSSTQSINEFLKSLKMIALVSEIGSSNLERCVQLINRSNQFNLTTKRYSTAEVLAISKSQDWVTFTVSLSDRFGDNGLISVLIARIEGKALIIDTWLMSCRVLKRGVENFLLEIILGFSQQRHLDRILGDYIPTAKNALVRDHYKSLGFEQVKEEAEGQTHWELPVPHFPIAPSTFIQVLNITLPIRFTVK